LSLRLAWLSIAVRTWRAFNRDKIPQLAGGVAFFALLSMFPAMGAFVSLYGLFADVSQAPRHLSLLAGVMPRGALTLAAEEMTKLAKGKHPALGLAFAVSLIAALWSASGAVKVLFVGLNTAYSARETRGLIRLNLVALAFSVAGLSFAMTAFGVLLAGPPALHALGWRGPLDPEMSAMLRWPLLFAAAAFSLTLLYRYGPCRPPGPWRWATVGSALSSFAWLSVSMGLSWYMGHVGHYERTYGALGAVVAFMTWLWLSIIVILTGAALNAEIETETAHPPGTRAQGRVAGEP